MLLLCPISLRLVVEMDIAKFLLFQNFELNCLTNDMVDDIFETTYIDV